MMLMPDVADPMDRVAVLYIKSMAALKNGNRNNDAKTVNGDEIIKMPNTMTLSISHAKKTVSL